MENNKNAAPANGAAVQGTASTKAQNKRKYYPRRPKAAQPAAPAAAAVGAAVTEEAAQPERKNNQQRGRRNNQPKKNNVQNQPAAQANAAAQQQKNAAQQKPVQQKQPRQNNQRGRGRNGGQKKSALRIIPLGGLGEVGKNMTLYECNGDMFLVDCGSMFPDGEMFGVDLVIPDFSYVMANKDKIKGIIITHGHEDHIGSLPYLLKQINLPIYATRLACGLIGNKLAEHGLKASAKLNVITPKQKVQLGCMSVTPIRVNHSIPDAVALAIETPAGTVIQTGDFKVDFTPVSDEVIDLAAFGAYGDKGVLALLSDSTNSERPGFSRSERSVGASFATLFARAEGKRIIIATFASNLQRIQQIIDMAVKYKRKVAISGRSMINNTAMAFELGYLKAPEGIIVDIDQIGRIRPEDLVIVTTGSQGEPLSALSRMSGGSHRNVRVGSGDFIIISATPIPGNEKMVTKVINSLMKLGAEVIYESMYDIHTSGHAYQEEQKLLLSLTKPKFFIPVHGEYKHLKKHALTAEDTGIPAKNILIADIGDVIRLTDDAIGIEDTVPAGRVLVDGLGVGDVGSVVLRDRRHLSEDGLIMAVAAVDSMTGSLVSGPDIVSRGFVYMKEAEDLIREAKTLVKEIIDKNEAEFQRRNPEELRGAVRDGLSTLMYRRTRRSPMILPVILEV
ncbi:ribonuclease J [Pygmaiobacter massiliensis]|uniref:ribonuclease J n=1 Tax=Pygmaiobacter massiliensis TaxID=1917873 RepID=UPI000C7A0154|nr:ribonuclease J [Pygmaiobacter massiliensis]